jgi:hypothetical protein
VEVAKMGCCLVEQVEVMYCVMVEVGLIVWQDSMMMISMMISTPMMMEMDGVVLRRS